MKVILTKQEGHNLMKQALMDYHSDLLRDADLVRHGSLNDFDLDFSTYSEDGFLTITEHESADTNSKEKE